MHFKLEFSLKNKSYNKTIEDREEKSKLGRRYNIKVSGDKSFIYTGEFKMSPPIFLHLFKILTPEIKISGDTFIYTFMYTGRV